MLKVLKVNSDGSVDLLGKQGATWELLLALTDDSDVPVSLVGYSIRGQIRKTYKSDVAYNFTCNIVDAQNGKFTISMSATDSASIPSADDKNYKHPDNTYVYDIELVDPSGKVTRILEGTLYLDPEVTRL
jgi:hypothetical protein